MGEVGEELQVEGWAGSWGEGGRWSAEEEEEEAGP